MTGIYEGEGYCGVRDWLDRGIRRRRPVVRISQANEGIDMLYRLRELTGVGSIWKHGPRAMQWGITGMNALTFLKTVWPHMWSEYKKEQALAVLAEFDEFPQIEMVR